MMGKKAETKRAWFSKFLNRMADDVHRALFRYQVKTGLIVCVVEPGDDQTDTATVDDDVQTVEDNGAVDQDDLNTEKADQNEASGQTETSAEEEVIVSIGDDAPSAEDEELNRAPDWVRELRKSKREADRTIREQREEIERLKGAGKSVAVEVGEEPTLEGCDFDTERFKSEWKTWNQHKQEQADQEKKQREAAEAEQRAWQSRLEAYGKAKGELKVKDYEDAEATVTDTLNVIQQGVILNGAENPALLVYALGKNPKKAKELAAIQDPVKFAFAVAKLETQLKVSPRKAAPPPEKPVRGSAPVSGAVDSQLERLREEAQRTRDLSKVIAYKRQKRA